MKHPDNRTVLLDTLKSGQAYFFAGSGISYLSDMPSAGKILCETADVFLPQNEDYKSAKGMIISSENNYRIQPEIFYEALLYIFNSTDTLMLWRSLSADFLKNFGFSVVPNINHLYIVDYSVKNNVPIFTTNFDCLFEEAAKKMGCDYQVLLPHTDAEVDTIKSFRSGTAKKGVAYIFKLHGSISSHGTESLDSFSTTMISISQANYPAIEFLEYMCGKKHIIFVGYSGRDIDYFPEIKKRSINYSPFWIDRFLDPATKENCEYINATPVHFYPNEIFEKEKPELNHPVLNIDNEVLEEVFENLKMELSNRIAINEDEKLLLLGLLTNDTGNYQLAYKLLLSLYRNNSLSVERQVILLLALSSLAHENSLYESCGFFAREALRKTKQEPNLDSFAIRALLQISESKRMLIAHDAVFFYNMNYLDAFFALLSFIFNSTLVRKKVGRLKSTNAKTIADIYSIHGFIEHKIRLFALVQALSKPILDRKETIIGKFLSAWLVKKWREIRSESFVEGHSHGIATSYRFETRVNYSVDDLKEGTHIYDMRTYATGKGLAVRNIADDNFERGNFADAKEYYYEFYSTGIKSGNRLNAIKGLFGIAKCNKALPIDPLLSPSDLEVLKDLIKRIEGKNWQRYFSKALNRIEN